MILLLKDVRILKENITLKTDETAFERRYIMITDEILSAVKGMIDKFVTPEAKRAGTAILEMLADFDEDDWYALNESGSVDDWLKQYIK